MHPIRRMSGAPSPAFRGGKPKSPANVRRLDAGGAREPGDFACLLCTAKWYSADRSTPWTHMTKVHHQSMSLERATQQHPVS